MPARKPPHAGTGPTLHGAIVRLRPWREEDVARFEAILAEPSVLQWWTPGEPDELARSWVGDDGRGATTFVIEHEGEVLGSIQAWDEEEPDYRSAGIDIFLGTAAQNRGFGPDAIRALARWLFVEQGHHRLTIDPAAANERAIRAYRKVGFRPIGVARQYERGRDGTWHDGLLMDLLPDELT
jgi:aminoglycoside 6'-N-acetyltransferase